MTAALGRRRLVVLVAMTLVVFGIVMVTSASSGEELLHGADQWVWARRQAVFAVAGLLLMWLMMRVPLELVRRLARPAVWLCFALIVIVMVPGIGHTANGATRWINLGVFQLQPSEPLKLAVCALLAAHLARTPPPRHAVSDLIKSPGGAALGLAALLVGAQSDLGSGLVIGGLMVVLYMLAGTSWRLLWRTIGPGVALVVLSIVTEDYRRQRFTAFLNPWADPIGSGYQLIQAQLAIGSGGPFGVGLGHSVQKITFLPEAHTDMIFSIIVEELGIFGVALVIGAFVVLAFVGIRISMRARTRFSSLLAAGITAMVVGQAAINIAGVTGVMPLTGIPLPLISYGGSSLVITLAALGLLANIATERRPARAVGAELVTTAVRGTDIDHDEDEFDFDDHSAPEHDTGHDSDAASARRGRRHRRSPGSSPRRR